MSEPFLGEIAMFGGNFAPRGWAFCSGQLLPIASNEALFSLLGTTYGGDGRTTFALPDMRGRVPMHPGTGPGLTPRRLGQRLGTEIHTLNLTEMPSHNHSPVMRANATSGGFATPTGNVLGNDAIYTRGGTADVSLGSTSIISNNVGGGQPFNIMQPSLGVNCIIALQGVFPSRS